MGGLCQVLALFADAGFEAGSTKGLTNLAMRSLYATAVNSKSEHCRVADPRSRVSRICRQGQNATANSSTARLRAAVLAHNTLPCDLCHIYGQDFHCLGYPFPERCAEPSCLQSLPPRLAAAVQEMGRI